MYEQWSSKFNLIQLIDTKLFILFLEWQRQDHRSMSIAKLSQMMEDQRGFCHHLNARRVSDIFIIPSFIMFLKDSLR